MVEKSFYCGRKLAYSKNLSAIERIQFKSRTKFQSHESSFLEPPGEGTLISMDWSPLKTDLSSS